MPILLVSLLAAGCLAVLAWLPVGRRAGARERGIAWTVVLLLAFLPLIAGAVVLGTARERTRTLRFDYVGKRLAFAADAPVTVGSSPPSSPDVEDLQAPLLGVRSVELLPASAATSSTAPAGGKPTGALLRLQSPSPAVRVDGKHCNSYELADGDAIEVALPGAAAERLLLDGNRLSWGSGSKDLPPWIVRLLGGGSRPIELARLDDRFVGVRSFLYLPRRMGRWHLLIRSDDVRVWRGGAEAAAFRADCPVPASFELSLEVVLDGTLRSQRRDEIVITGDEVEIRFGAPRRWARAVPPSTSTLDLALGVPSSYAREGMIEIPEQSPRFQGLVAAYRYDAGADRATLTYLGDEQPVERGGLYALGSEADRLLLRLDSQRFPRVLLLDLALLSLYLAVFLGRGMATHFGLAAIVGPAGLLLSLRLLFSHKAASQPPHFAIDAFEEARLAGWLVPAVLVFAWALAWIVRQPTAAAPAAGMPGPADASAPVRQPLGLEWPIGGLLLASAGAWVATLGSSPGRRALALLPLLLGSLLFLARRATLRPRRAAAVARLRERGIPWPVVAIAACGLLVFLLRLAGVSLGMPETMRFPWLDFRLLWTVVQVPLCSVAVGLTIERLRRAPAPAPADAASRWGRLTARVPAWLLGVAAYYLFVVAAFLAVGILVGDTGLVLVHALAPLVALFFFALTVPASLGGRAVRATVAALAAAPLLVVVLVNARPGMLLSLFGWGATEAAEPATVGAAERERAAELSSARTQQMFRLYMLANPQRLADVGIDSAERAGLQHSLLQSYARLGGTFGKGFLAGDLPRHLGRTYLSDLVPMVFVLAEFGKAGMLGLALLYLLPLAAVPLTLRARQGSSTMGVQGLHVGFAALAAFALPGLYMLLANLNFVLFTGKNMSLLALNSLSDVLESGALLAVALLGLGMEKTTT